MIANFCQIKFLVDEPLKRQRKLFFKFDRFIFNKKKFIFILYESN